MSETTSPEKVRAAETKGAEAKDTTDLKRSARDGFGEEPDLVDRPPSDGPAMGDARRASPDRTPNAVTTMMEDVPVGEWRKVDHNIECMRKADGGLVTKCEVQADAVKRLGFERQLPPGVEVGLTGWQRAHTIGPWSGGESQYGVLYAPEKVNQALQNRGIESYVRDIRRSAPDAKVTLTTETTAHPGTNRLKEIAYRVEASNVPDGVPRLFEAYIQVENRVDDPRVRAGVNQGGHEAWDEY